MEAPKNDNILDENNIIKDYVVLPDMEIKIFKENESENCIKDEKKEDKRTITKEIIDIINKDIYKKYRGKNENELMKLKITEENFTDCKALLEVADLLKIKKIIFENITTDYFNDLLTANSFIAKKFKQYNLPEELKTKIPEEEKGHFEELERKETINLEEIIFKNSEIDINFSNTFPIIKKFKLINCQMPFNVHNKINFNFLTQLILENIGLINENFEHLFFQIRININLRKNLKIISFKNNNIGMLDLCKGIPENQIKAKAEFPNLEIMDFSNNKIFFISKVIINIIKNIKIIDLTNNSIAFSFAYNTFIEAVKKKIDFYY